MKTKKAFWVCGTAPNSLLAFEAPCGGGGGEIRVLQRIPNAEKEVKDISRADFSSRRIGIPIKSIESCRITAVQWRRLRDLG